MSRLTVAEFKSDFNWPQILNMESSDPRWLQLLNEASQRLLNMAMWMGTTQRYAVCVNNGCLTWPRQFETIIAMDACCGPVTLRSQWHEFLENGPGMARVSGNSGSGQFFHHGFCGGMQSYDRGTGFVMFDDLTVDSVIRLYPQFAVDVGKTVTIRGLDDDYQPVLTDNGNIEGEVMTIASPFVDSTTIWGKQVFRQVLKQITKGHIRAFSYDASLPVPPASPGPNDTPLKALAVWEPTETLPDYRRSFIPSLSGCGGGCANDDELTAVTVIAKIKFIRLVSDLDFLPIGNGPALTKAMLSVMLAQRGDFTGATRAMQGDFDPDRRRYVEGAVPILEEELAAYQGDGVVVTMRRQPENIAGSGILNLI